MRISVEQKDTYAIARLYGELDLNTAGPVRDTLDQAVADSHTLGLVLNLSGVTFMDSTGLGVILGRFRRLKERGGQMVIVGASPQVKPVLELSGILRIMPWYADETEAVG